MPDSIKIEFNEDGLKDLVSGWVIQQMSGEQREAVLANAVKYLITQPKDNYGRAGNSPLELAFNIAIERVMRDIATDMIENDPEVRAKLTTLLGETFGSFMGSWAGESAKRALINAVIDHMAKP